MLMSKSRLEKFLYALYSLDSSDLPKPLSRIEELYSCLVTGEGVPFFEPLSRVEKYLMAILGGYDIDSLPNPISRVEVLLYKLATGDDNLDDVETFLSEHEELLAEIIRNGGVGGNINIEYVLYTLSTEHNTLYNTAAKPIKSAILKGRTLVNLIPNTTISWACANSSAWLYKYVELNQQLKPNTIYTIIANVLETNGDGTVSLTMGGKTGAAFQTKNVGIKKGRNVFTAETYSDGQGKLNFVFFQIQDNYVGNFTLNDFIILEGDHSNEDIPYFEGMQSVKMPVLTTTGKNLFDGELKIGTIFSNGTTGAIEDCLRSSNYIKLEQNIDYVISNNKGYAHVIFGYNSNKEFVKRIGSYNGNGVFKLTGNIEYIMFRSSDALKQNDLSVKYQIEKGTVATPFEPYKSNILTVNEPIELRGIGNVKDELNCLTGEVTERIGEIVLDGSEKRWELAQDRTNTMRFNCYSLNIPYGINGSLLKTDKLPYQSPTIGDQEGVVMGGGTTPKVVSISIMKTKLPSSDIDGFKQWLSQNPITIQYQLATESIKTVDLSVVDQDGNDTKLKTFNDITHVTLSSEGLIPEAELKVATKNEEDLEDSSVYTTHTLSEEFNTLYNTAKKPVKSAILKGNTLVNLAPNDTFKGSAANRGQEFTLTQPIQPNKQYILLVNITKDDTVGGWHCRFTDGVNYPVIQSSIKGVGLKKVVFTTSIALSKFFPYFSAEDCEQGRYITMENIILLEYQQGMENWDIPYFEGMLSVKMPVLTTYNSNIFPFKEYIEGTGATEDKDYIYVKGNFNFIIPLETDGNIYTLYVDGEVIKGDNFGEWKFIFEDGTERGIYFKPSTTSFDTLNKKLIELKLRNPFNAEFKLKKSSLCFNLKSIGQEPHESNILTVNEEVVLRKVGDVQDELDLTTGELTQRVKEVVLNGSENWMRSVDFSSLTNTVHFQIQSDTVGIESDSPLTSDKFINRVVWNSDMEGINCASNGNLAISINRNKLSGLEVADFKKWLSQNNVTVVGKSTESIKTVDLSTVNQDGNDTKLSTFNDITHVTLSSEGLIPEAKLEVAEKVPEVAASILTISREQEVINATANEQSENVDATMIATTEIYEGLL